MFLIFCLLIVECWASYLNVLDLSFFTCKMGMMKSVWENCCEVFQKTIHLKGSALGSGSRKHLLNTLSGCCYVTWMIFLTSAAVNLRELPRLRDPWALLLFPLYHLSFFLQLHWGTLAPCCPWPIWAISIFPNKWGTHTIPVAFTAPQKRKCLIRNT